MFSILQQGAGRKQNSVSIVPVCEILKQAPLSSGPTIQSVNCLNLMCFVHYLILHPVMILSQQKST
jgi:hypothetical protein